MKKIYSIILLATITSIVFFACKSPDVYLREGNYDVAITKAVKKLKKKNKEAYVIVLEKALAKANQRDLDRISFLKKEGTPEGWVEIANRYNSIEYRQNKIKPLIPLEVPSEARSARFNFINAVEERIQAKQKAADFLYADAIQLLKTNDRMNARKAYANLTQVKSYFNSFKDTDAQLVRAKELGTNKVLFRMLNGSGNPLPPQFERDLTKISLSNLNKQWLVYHTTRRKDVFYDYDIIANMKVIAVSDPIKEQKAYNVKKEVQDGWEYVLDRNGNVTKDTAGNDVKLPKYKTVVTLVKENSQRKTARISGSVDFFDNRSKQLIKTLPVTSDAVFENFYATAEGDIKILDEATKKKLQGKFLPFPQDFNLLMQCGQTIRPMIKNIINQNSGIIKY